jgi:hypothetical protein
LQETAIAEYESAKKKAELSDLEGFPVTGVAKQEDTTWRPPWIRGRSASDSEPSPGLMPEGIDQILSKLTQQIESAGARILRLGDYPDAAIEGLQDQILQTGAGRTKPDGGKQVKTGAADSTSWRLVEHEAGDDLAQVVIVTGDRDVKRHFSGDPTPYVIGTLFHATQEVSKLETPNDAATASLQEAVIAQLAKLAAVYPLVSNAQSAFDLEHVGQIRQTRAKITSLDIVDFREISAFAFPGFGTAVLDVVVSISLEYVVGDDVDAQVFFESKDGVRAVVEVFATRPDRAGAWDILIADLKIDRE